MSYYVHALQLSLLRKILLAFALLCMSLSQSFRFRIPCRPATVRCKMKCKLLAAVDQEIRIAAVTELEHLGCNAHAESLQQTL